MSERATYLYAVTRTRDLPAIRNIGGVADAPVRIVGAGPYGIVSTVPLSEFGEEALKRELEDLHWLEQTARAHNRVVDAVHSSGPTAPVRLCTIYRDDDRVMDLLEDRRADFDAVLGRLTGRREWGIQIIAHTETDAGPTENAADPTAPGTAYLLMLQARRGKLEAARLALTERADDVYATVRDIAAACRRYPPQDRRLAGGSGEMILNAAYLVDITAEPELRGQIERFRDSGMDVRLTGPWPPYSFAELEGA